MTTKHVSLLRVAAAGPGERTPWMVTRKNRELLFFAGAKRVIFPENFLFKSVHYSVEMFLNLYRFCIRTI